MTASELKALYEQANPVGFFFSRGALRFFGDTLRNYGVRPCVLRSTWEDDEGKPDFAALELYRRRAVKHGLAGSHYFGLDGKELSCIEEV